MSTNLSESLVSPLVLNLTMKDREFLSVRRAPQTRVILPEVYSIGLSHSPTQTEPVSLSSGGRMSEDLENFSDWFISFL